jgi:hypothetical protein
MQIFLDAYNFAKRLKTLNGLTPFESVCKAWTKEPNRFKYDPVQLTSGLHTYDYNIKATRDQERRRVQQAEKIYERVVAGWNRRGPRVRTSAAKEGDNNGCAARLSPQTLLFATQSLARFYRIAEDSQKKIVDYIRLPRAASLDVSGRQVEARKAFSLIAPGAHAVFPPRFLKIGFAVCSIEVSNLAWPLR